MLNSNIKFITKHMAMAAGSAMAFALLMSGSNLMAQTPVRVTLGNSYSGNRTSEAYVYESVDIPPCFPGGDAAMMRFINNERRYPREAYQKAVEGRVLCSFVVEADGSLTNVELVRGVEESLNNEALRIVEAMPRWIPGEVGGNEVRVYCIIPIPFRR